MDHDNISLLLELGLTKYEAMSYLTLLEKGISEANTVCKYGNIPMGKIYETLTSLNNKNMIEIQNTRPKKFLAKDPKIAFEKLYHHKKVEVETQLKNFKVITQKFEQKVKPKKINEKHQMFWSAITGYDEVLKNMKDMFDETQKEICFIISSKCEHKIEKIDKFMPEIINHSIATMKRDVKFRMIYSTKKEKNVSSHLKKIEIPEKLNEVKEHYCKCKVLDHTDSFYIIDDRIAVLELDNPIDGSPLATVKIYDEVFARNLRKEFDRLWNQAKEANIF